MREGDKVRYIYKLFGSDEEFCDKGYIENINNGVITVNIQNEYGDKLVRFHAPTMTTMPDEIDGRLEFVSALSWDKLYLFVWTAFSPDYRAGLAFAIAHNEYEARKLVIKSNHGSTPLKWGSCTRSDLTNTIAYSVAGGS